jgi:hypothetical protein
VADLVEGITIGGGDRGGSAPRAIRSSVSRANGDGSVFRLAVLAPLIGRPAERFRR